MEDLTVAIDILKQGGIVIYPTDTAFGIGCRIDNKKSVKRLFKLKERPENQATPVLVGSVEMALDYLLSPVPNDVRHLMDKYWSGALTIVYPCIVDKVPPLVRGGGENLGVRMPNHDITLSLINGVGVPILGPSANIHGKATPYKFDQLDKTLLKLVDYVVKGKCPKGNVSTVIDCSKSRWKIIRQGAVNIDSMI